MALFTVTVTAGTAREVFGGLTACDNYIRDMIGEGAAAYRALTGFGTAGGDDRMRLLIEATRFIDRQKWTGEANAFGGTVLQWPRSGITDADGDVLTNAQQLALVEQAVFELVAILAADSSTKDSADQGSNIKSMGAGSAKLEFFGPTSARRGTATKLPTVVDDLLGRYLAGSGLTLTLAGGAATGTDAEPFFTEDTDFERSGPF